MSCSVYIISKKETGEIKYVGVAVNPAQRWGQHKRAAIREDGYTLGRAIRKYGHKAFELIPVIECRDSGEAKAVEISLIREYGTFNNGYNQTLGGDGTSGWMPTKKQRLNTSIRNKSNWADPEFRAATIAAMSAAPLSPSFGAAISKRRTGVKMSDANA